ncbi:hypothetical protein ACFL1T_01845 [Chlamydiota bacterium]
MKKNGLHLLWFILFSVPLVFLFITQGQLNAQEEITISLSAEPLSLPADGSARALILAQLLGGPAGEEGVANTLTGTFNIGPNNKPTSQFELYNGETLIADRTLLLHEGSGFSYTGPATSIRSRAKGSNDQRTITINGADCLLSPSNLYTFTSTENPMIVHLYNAGGSGNAMGHWFIEIIEGPLVSITPNDCIPGVAAGLLVQFETPGVTGVLSEAEVITNAAGFSETMLTAPLRNKPGTIEVIARVVDETGAELASASVIVTLTVSGEYETGEGFVSSYEEGEGDDDEEE